MSQANFCIRQNPELQHTSISELATLSRNGGSRNFLQSIYKYTSNITGSDPYWFQRRRELIAQAEQEGLKGTLFWTLSAADNHWKDLMKLLDVPQGSNIQTRCQAVRNNPHIVDYFFCRRVERAVEHLFRKCLIADWIWYRYEFQMRGSAHAHGMMSLKIAPDILNAVKTIYQGNKATEMLECMVEFAQMSNQAKADFAAAAAIVEREEDIAIHDEYNKCLAASLMTEDAILEHQHSINEGNKAEALVICFHNWLVVPSMLSSHQLII